MNLSPEQTRAMDGIRAWLKNPMKQTFLLAGYAGTGKTTLLQHFVNSQPNIVICCAPTGKAASVLQRKLENARVSTVHRALYTPIAPSTAQLEQLEAELLNHPNNDALRLAVNEEKARLSQKDLKFSLKQDALISRGQLVVIDETSMVTRRMRKDLEDTGAKILYVGDPGQLPPVLDEGFFERYRPDAMLEEVHRQAKESPIIQASMRVRNGASVAPTGDTLGPFRKLPKDALPPAEWLTYDQVITGTNDARRRINRYFRRQLKRDVSGWWPVENDKLICLKNDQDGDTFYINGIQATALGTFRFNTEFQEMQGDILYEGQIIHANSFYRFPFQAHYDYHSEAGRTVLHAVEEPWHARQGLREFDYAYSITVHKAQGSEFDRVLLADDGMKAGDAEFRKKWLYTAITRAKKTLVWLY